MKQHSRYRSIRDKHVRLAEKTTWKQHGKTASDSKLHLQLVATTVKQAPTSLK